MADSIIPKDLMKDELKNMAYKAFKDLVQVSRSAVEMFYGDYSPAYYQRAFGMYNLYTPRMELGDNRFAVEFTYSPAYMSVTSGNSNYAFSAAFVNGKHGGEQYFGNSPVPVTSPSPWEMIADFVRVYKV